MVYWNANGKINVVLHEAGNMNTDDFLYSKLYNRVHTVHTVDAYSGENNVQKILENNVQKYYIYQ